MAKAQLHSKAPSEEKKKLAGKTQKPLEQELQAETPSLLQTPNNLQQSTPMGMQMLQRTVGNRAVQSLVGQNQNRTNDSTIIQRHMGANAQGLWASGEPMLLQARDNIETNTHAVSQGAGSLLLALDAARDEPVPQPGESRPDSGGEGHGYEFDDDVQESDISRPDGEYHLR